MFAHYNKLQVNLLKTYLMKVILFGKKSTCLYLWKAFCFNSFAKPIITRRIINHVVEKYNIIGTNKYLVAYIPLQASALCQLEKNICIESFQIPSEQKKNVDSNKKNYVICSCVWRLLAFPASQHFSFVLNNVYLDLYDSFLDGFSVAVKTTLY